MANRTDVDVVNLAIAKVGGEPLEALTEDTPLGAWASTAYPQRRDYCLSIYTWRFNTMFAQLAQATTTPANCPRRHLYAPPADLIGEARAFRDGPHAHSRHVDCLVSNMGIASHHARVWMEYGAAVPEAAWSTWFLELVVTAFASDIARRRPDADLADKLWAIAFGAPEQNLEGGLFLQARQADSRNAPERPLTWDPGPLVEARIGPFVAGVYGRPLIVFTGEEGS